MGQYDNYIETAGRTAQRYANAAAAREDMAAYLLELAAADRERQAYWQGEQQRFLGLAGVDNVVELIPVQGGDYDPAS